MDNYKEKYKFMRKFLLIFIIVSVFYSCSSSESEKLLSKISDVSKVYSIEDFSEFGLKIGEEYDSSDLPHAQSVYWGFWKDVEADEGSARFQSLGGSVGGMREFEIRFYDSHEDAVNHGIKYADDATGRNAVLTKQESLWPEGIRNRRTSGGPDGSPLPKFGDYVIFGNLIVFCEGMSSEEAIQNCSRFLKNLE